MFGTTRGTEQKVRPVGVISAQIHYAVIKKEDNTKDKKDPKVIQN